MRNIVAAPAAAPKLIFTQLWGCVSRRAAVTLQPLGCIKEAHLAETPPVVPDRIEKRIDIAAPIERVWRAVGDYREFGAWFRVKLEGPFVAGHPCAGQITYPGYEHLRMEIVVRAVEPPTRLAFTWHPFAIEPGEDYSGEPSTLVEIRLEVMPGGTRATVTESGFSRIPAHRRAKAFEANSGGWTQQTVNLSEYVLNSRAPGHAGS
jgi:uncharacterized protein YndB with AHSA1/START domain